MFEEISSKIESNVSIDVIESFEKALELKRETYVSLLQKNIRTLFNGLEADIEEFFKLKEMISRNKVAIIKRLANSTIKTYVDSRAIKFLDKLDLKASKELHGVFKWTDGLTSLQCIKWHNAGLFPRNYFMSKETFSFLDHTVHLRHDPGQLSRHQKHHYLFDLLDKNSNVLSSIPFELGHDIFAAPTAVYCYGTRLLLVTSFQKILTNLIFNMLKRLDVNGEMPEKRPNGYYNACYFALFDANLKLVKELAICEAPLVGSYSIVVDFIDQNGIMVSKIFKQTYNHATKNMQQCFKRVVSFYDYNFEPVISDFTLPVSSSNSNVIKLENNLIQYASYNASDSVVTLLTFDVDRGVEVGRRLIPWCWYHIRSCLPAKLLLDSKNNLYAVSRNQLINLIFGVTHEYHLSCANLDNHELQVIRPPASTLYRGCYLNEKDQLVIVSASDADRSLTFNTFAF